MRAWNRHERWHGLCVQLSGFFEDFVAMLGTARVTSKTEVRVWAIRSLSLGLGKIFSLAEHIFSHVVPPNNQVRVKGLHLTADVVDGGKAFPNIGEAVVGMFTGCCRGRREVTILEEVNMVLKPG